MTSRREFLRNTTALIGGGVALTALAACTTGSSVGGVSTAFLNFAQSLLAEFQGVVPILTAAGTKVPASIGTTVGSIITSLQALSAASSENTGASVLNQIIADVNAVAPTLIPIVTALNPAVGAAFGLAVAVMPAAEALLSAGIATFTQLTSSAKVLVAAAPAPTAAGRVGSLVAAPTSEDYLNELLHRHGL